MSLALKAVRIKLPPERWYSLRSRLTTSPNVQIFEDPPINDTRVKGAVFGTSLDEVEEDNIYMLYEGRHNSLPGVVSSLGQTVEYA